MKNKTVWNFIPRSLSVAVASCLFSLITVNSALAAPVEIADVPPFLGGSVAPNIMFIIDDSGSMQFELPEGSSNSNTDYLFPQFPICTAVGPIAREFSILTTTTLAIDYSGHTQAIHFFMTRRRPTSLGFGR